MPITDSHGESGSKRVFRNAEADVVHYEVKISLLAAGGRKRVRLEVGRVYDDFSHFAISFSRSNLGSSGSVTTVWRHVSATEVLKRKFTRNGEI